MAITEGGNLVDSYLSLLQLTMMMMTEINEKWLCLSSSFVVVVVLVAIVCEGTHPPNTFNTI